MLIPQERLLHEAIERVLRYSKVCKRNKCDLECGTMCVLVSKELSDKGQLETVTTWEHICQAKEGHRATKYDIEELDNMEKQLRSCIPTALEREDSEERRVAIELAKTSETIEQEKIKKRNGSK